MSILYILQTSLVLELKPLSFLNNKIDTYVNSPVNFDIVCTATAIKDLCQARDMSDTQLFNLQELTIMINTLFNQ